MVLLVVLSIKSFMVLLFLMEKLVAMKNRPIKNCLCDVFLGMFNLMFNWGHHIYLLPTEKIHSLHRLRSEHDRMDYFDSYFLQMEPTNQRKQTVLLLFPLSILMASDYWVTLNLTLALFMSIPAINLYHARNAYHGGACHGNYHWD